MMLVPDGWVDGPLGRLEQYQRHIDPVPAPGTDTGLELTCSCRDATSLDGPLGGDVDVRADIGHCGTADTRSYGVDVFSCWWAPSAIKTPA